MQQQTTHGQTVTDPSSTAAGRHGPPGLRATVWGAAVIVGGTLVVNTIVGIAAITGLLVSGNSAESIVAQLPNSLALAVFVAAGGLLMNLCGGYVAANLAPHSQLKHALAAGIVATVLTLAMLPLWGDPHPLAMAALSIFTIVPCAALGAWLAMPVAVGLREVHGTN